MKVYKSDNLPKYFGSENTDFKHFYLPATLLGQSSNENAPSEGNQEVSDEVFVDELKSMQDPQEAMPTGFSNIHGTPKIKPKYKGKYSVKDGYEDVFPVVYTTKINQSFAPAIDDGLPVDDCPYEEEEISHMEDDPFLEKPIPMSQMTSEHNGEYEQIIRSSLKMLRIPESTHLLLIAVDKKCEVNKYNKVRCAGEPIAGFAYEVATDTYMVDCAAYKDLGTIPLSYKMSMANSHWCSWVLLPDELIELCLSQKQKSLVAAFREQFKDERYAIQYVQSVQS